MVKSERRKTDSERWKGRGKGKDFRGSAARWRRCGGEHGEGGVGAAKRHGTLCSVQHVMVLPGVQEGVSLGLCVPHGLLYSGHYSPWGG